MQTFDTGLADMKSDNHPAPEGQPDGTPAAPGAPRKRGKPKGLPKSGGRQKGTTNWTSEAVRAELLPKAMQAVVDILGGKAIQTTATTGKPIWKRPSHAEILRAAELALAKCLPDLASTELTGKDGDPLYPSEAESHRPRDVARAVLSLLREAEIEGQGEHVAFAGPGQTLVRVSDPDLARAILPDSGPADAAQVNESEVFDNGATIQLVRVQTGHLPDASAPPILKWEVRDQHGELHGMKRERADAEALAKALP